MNRRLGRDAERGAGTVLVLMAVLTITTALGAALILAEGYVARHRASAAADLAALAGATVATDPATACARAEEVANANQAQLVDCVVAGAEVEVLVEVELTKFSSVLEDPRRRARAGPGGRSVP